MQHGHAEFKKWKNLRGRSDTVDRVVQQVDINWMLESLTKPVLRVYDSTKFIVLREFGDG